MIGTHLRGTRRVWFLAVGCFLLPGRMCAQTGNPVAQSPTTQDPTTRPAGGAPLSFEVATIKPAAPSPDGHTHINYPPGDRFSAINITLLNLLNWAFQMPTKQILDGPPWLGSTRFDLQAKLDPANLPANASGEDERARRRAMVQSLLEERCNLRFHEETRTLPAYDLVPAKGGIKLQVSTNNGRSMNTGRNHLDLSGLEMKLIAEELSRATDRVVVDKSGLTGRYDVHLKWRPDDASPDSPDATLPSFFTAVEEQLGLKLEPAKEAIPVLVIDHIDLPSAN